MSGGQRHHPAGVHRAAPVAARIARFHGPARDRLALLAGHLPGARFPGQESHPVHLDRRGDRSPCGPPAEAVRRHRGRYAGGGFRRHAALAQPFQRATCRRDRHTPAAGRQGLRSGRGRRRSGGTGRGGLRRVRRTAHRGARTYRARRTGRQQHADRKLPGLSHRADRHRAGRPRDPAGQQIRRPSLACPPASTASASRTATPWCIWKAADRDRQVPADRHRRGLPPPGRGRLRSASKAPACTTRPPSPRGSCARART